MASAVNAKTDKNVLMINDLRFRGFLGGFLIPMWR